MTDSTLLDIVKRIPDAKKQELYDFACFLADNYSVVNEQDRVAAFESESEMLDFIQDVGKNVYAD